MNDHQEVPVVAYTLASATNRASYESPGIVKRVSNRFAGIRHRDVGEKNENWRES